MTWLPCFMWHLKDDKSCSLSFLPFQHHVSTKPLGLQHVSTKARRLQLAHESCFEKREKGLKHLIVVVWAGAGVQESLDHNETARKIGWIYSCCCFCCREWGGEVNHRQITHSAVFSAHPFACDILRRLDVTIFVKVDLSGLQKHAEALFGGFLWRGRRTKGNEQMNVGAISRKLIGRFSVCSAG